MRRHRTGKGISVVAANRGAGTFQPTRARPLFTGVAVIVIQGMILLQAREDLQQVWAWPASSSAAPRVA